MIYGKPRGFLLCPSCHSLFNILGMNEHNIDIKRESAQVSLESHSPPLAAGHTVQSLFVGCLPLYNDDDDDSCELSAP